MTTSRLFQGVGEPTQGSFSSTSRLITPLITGEGETNDRLYKLTYAAAMPDATLVAVEFNTKIEKPRVDLKLKDTFLLMLDSDGNSAE